MYLILDLLFVSLGIATSVLVYGVYKAFQSSLAQAESATTKLEEQMKKIKQIQQELVAFRPQIALSATYQNINPFQQQFPDFLAAMKTGLLATQECEALRSLGEESEYNKTLHRFNETPARIPLANSNPSAPGLLNIPVEAPLQGEI